MASRLITDAQRKRLREMADLIESRPVLGHWPSSKAVEDGDLLRTLARNSAMVMIALEESVKLQSHYAELLNMHDGGERMKFASAEAWMERLEELTKPTTCRRRNA